MVKLRAQLAEAQAQAKEAETQRAVSANYEQELAKLREELAAASAQRADAARAQQEIAKLREDLTAAESAKADAEAANEATKVSLSYLQAEVQQAKETETKARYLCMEFTRSLSYFIALLAVIAVMEALVCLLMRL